MKRKTSTPRFLADHMNGDIAKWLRIMGFDCAYPSYNKTDNEILNICIKEKRILLTRDRELHSTALRKGVKSILLRENSLKKKFAEILDKINLFKFTAELKPRCTVCNTELEKEKPSNITIKTKPPIHADLIIKYDFVFICPNCNKIYWEGSHWKKINETIAELRRLAKNRKD